MAELRTKNFNVKLSETEHSKLQKLAEITHVSTADVMRLLLINGKPEDVMRIPGRGETTGKKMGRPKVGKG
jgi:hypothetical protein